jgi:Lrp/AsnC family transcriptional regulator, leucine-responsive regulatory protein
MQLDAIDRSILQTLQVEGRIANSELARRIGISAPAMHERVKKLEAARVIERYVALVDPSSVGIHSHFYVETKLSPHTKDAVAEFVAAAQSMTAIMECHHVTGDADFLLKISVSDIQAYEDLILHGLTELPHVSSLKTMVVLSTFKKETAFPIEGSHDDLA